MTTLDVVVSVVDLCAVVFGCMGMYGVWLEARRDRAKPATLFADAPSAPYRDNAPAAVLLPADVDLTTEQQRALAITATIPRVQILRALPPPTPVSERNLSMSPMFFLVPGRCQETGTNPVHQHSQSRPR